MVFRTARRLQQALAGRPLTRVELRWGDLDGAPLLGRQTLEVVPRGKHLLHRVAGGWTLHTHLRMEGSWRVVRAAELGARDVFCQVVPGRLSGNSPAGSAGFPAV